MSESENEELVELDNDDLLSEEEDDECSEKKTEKINLTLQRRDTSFLEEVEMIELIPIERIKALLKSGFLKEHWDNTNDAHIAFVKKNYDSEVAQLTAYLKGYRAEEKGIPVKYIKPKHKWGRPFPANSLGLTSIRRKVRNTLIHGLYKDYDLKNAQPTLIVVLCKSNNINCNTIEDYCLNREKWLSRIMKMYDCDRDTAKDLFIRLCFFGTFKGWLYENKITKQKLPTQRILDFENEITEIAIAIKKVNKDLYETARQKQKNSKEQKTNTNSGKDKVLGSMFAMYCCEWEYRIVGAVKQYLYENTDLYNNPFLPLQTKNKVLVGTYEYDGVKLYLQNAEKFETEKEVSIVEYLNKITEELTGLKLEWADKEIEDPYDITAFIEQVKEEENPDEDLKRVCDFLTEHLTNADKGICDLLKQSPYGEYYIYAVNKNEKEGDWKCWDENKNRWSNGDSILRRDLSGKFAKWLKSLLNPFKKYEIQDANTATLSVNQKHYIIIKRILDEAIVASLMKQQGNNNIVGKAKGEFRNDSVKFDTNINLFGCENGVIDIENGVFRGYRYDDFVSMSNGKNSVEDNFRPFMKGLKIEVKIKVYNVVEVVNTETHEHISYREPTKAEFDKLKTLYEDKDIINENDIYTITSVINTEGELIENRPPTEEERPLFIEDKPTGFIKLFRIIEKNEGTKTDIEMLNEINSLIEKIIPNKELRNYFWLILASGLSGKAIEKFFVFNGGGRNGKGLINEFMRYCLGDYACELNVVVLTEDPTKSGSSGANVEKAKLNKVRYVITAEPNGKVKLNNSTIKKITGGGELSARMNYSNNSEVMLMLTLVLECNKKPPFVEEPINADKDRINDVFFESRFTDRSEEWGEEFEKQHIYKQNPELKTPKWFKEHKNAFLNILFTKVLELKANEWNIDLHKPQSVKDRSEEYLNKSSDIYSIFKTLFERHNDERSDLYIDWDGTRNKSKEDWSVAKVVSEIMETEDYAHLIKDRQKKAEYGTAKLIKEWIMTKGTPLNPFVLEDKKNKQVKLKGWRKFIELEEE